MSYSKLPADPNAMALGIVSLLLGISVCCCSSFAAPVFFPIAFLGPVLQIVPLVLGIIGLVIANKSLKEYKNNTEAYSPQSRSNVYTAKIINIISVVINGITVLLFLISIIVFGSVVSNSIIDDYRNRNTEIESYENYDFDDYEDDEESEEDVNEDSKGTYQVEEKVEEGHVENDSIN